MIANDKILFLHIPKTAGTTFYDCLKQAYGKRHIVEFHGVPESSIKNFRSCVYNLHKSEIACIKGHMYFGLHRHLEEPSRYITFMRDPVKRMISLYRYLKQSPSHSQYGLVAGKSLESFAVDCHLHSNGQTRFLAGGNPVDPEEVLLARAKENLVNHFAVVGLTERFDESLVLLKQHLGWVKNPSYIRENISRELPLSYAPNPKILQIIEQKNSADIQLYQYAVTLFERQIQQFADDFECDFEHELATFHQHQQARAPLNYLYSKLRSRYLTAKTGLAILWRTS